MNKFENKFVHAQEAADAATDLAGRRRRQTDSETTGKSIPAMTSGVA